MAVTVEELDALDQPISPRRRVTVEDLDQLGPGPPALRPSLRERLIGGVKAVSRAVFPFELAAPPPAPPEPAEPLTPLPAEPPLEPVDIRLKTPTGPLTFTRRELERRAAALPPSEPIDIRPERVEEGIRIREPGETMAERLTTAGERAARIQATEETIGQQALRVAPPEPLQLPSLMEAAKRGAAASAVGTAAQLAAKVALDQRLQLDPRYDPGPVDRAVETLVSIGLDTPIFLLGGFIGGIPARLAVGRTLAQLTERAIQRGFAREAAKEIAQRTFRVHAAKEAVVAAGAGRGAGMFALRDALAESVRGPLETGELQPTEVLKAGAKGAALGAAVFGPAALVTQPTLRFLTEVGLFGAAGPPIQEGRPPTLEDLVEAGVALGTLRVAFTLPRRMQQALRRAPALRTRAEQAELDAAAQEVRQTQAAEAEVPIEERLARLREALDRQEALVGRGPAVIADVLREAARLRERIPAIEEAETKARREQLRRETVEERAAGARGLPAEEIPEFIRREVERQVSEVLERRPQVRAELEAPPVAGKVVEPFGQPERLRRIERAEAERTEAEAARFPTVPERVISRRPIERPAEPERRLELELQPEPPREAAAPEIPPDPELLREFYLKQIDEWKSGAKATVGRPATGERYALEMRQEIKRLESLLDGLPSKIPPVRAPEPPRAREEVPERVSPVAPIPEAPPRRNWLESLAPVAQERVFGEMRRLDAEAGQLEAQSRALMPKTGEVAIGAGAFDPFIRAHAIYELLRALRQGHSPSAAVNLARAAVVEAIRVHNAKRPRDINWKRDSGTADAELLARYQAVLNASVQPAPPAPPEPTVPLEPRPAPVEWAGWQERLNRPPLAQWDLTEEIPGHPKGSTLSTETLRREGFTVPEPPEEPPPSAPTAPVPPPPSALRAEVLPRPQPEIAQPTAERGERKAVRASEQAFAEGIRKAEERFGAETRDFDRVLGGIAEALQEAGVVRDFQEGIEAISRRWHQPLASMSPTQGFDNIVRGMENVFQSRVQQDRQTIERAFFEPAAMRKVAKTRREASDLAQQLENELKDVRFRVGEDFRQARDRAEGLSIQAKDIEALRGRTETVEAARRLAQEISERRESQERTIRTRIAELRQQAETPSPEVVRRRIEAPSEADQLAARLVDEVSPSQLRLLAESPFVRAAAAGDKMAEVVAEIRGIAKATTEFVKSLKPETLRDAIEVLESEDGLTRPYAVRSRQLKTSDLRRYYGPESKMVGYAGELEGRPFWGTGHFVEFTEAPKGLDVLRGENIPKIENIIPKQRGQPLEPTAIVSKLNEIERVFLRKPDGSFIGVNRSYWDHFLTRHPKAQAFGINDQKPITLMEGDRLVGVLMGMRGEPSPAVGALGEQAMKAAPRKATPGQPSRRIRAREVQEPVEETPPPPGEPEIKEHNRRVRKMPEEIEEIGGGTVELGAGPAPTETALLRLQLSRYRGQVDREKAKARAAENAARQGLPPETPTVVFHTPPKDYGIFAWIGSPANILPRYGPIPKRAIETLNLAEIAQRVEYGRRMETDREAIAKIPRAHFGRQGEVFWQLFEGVPLEDILARPDLSEGTKAAARHFREKFDRDRTLIRDRLREGLRPSLRAQAERQLRRERAFLEEGQRRRTTEQAGQLRDRIEEETDRAVREAMPDDWGIADYLPHVFPGEFVLSVERPEGRAFIGSARTRAEALAKIAEHHARNPEEAADRYHVQTRLFLSPDVVRVSTPRRWRLIGELSKRLEVDKGDIAGALRGVIGTKEGRQKWWGSLQHREGYAGFTRDLEWVLSVYNSGLSRWIHVTDASRAVEPMIRELRNQGQPNLADELEANLKILWGYKSPASAALDAQLERTPGLRTLHRPFALERWANRVKGLTAFMFLTVSPRFHFLNRLQTFQTLLPLGVRDFWRGRTFYVTGKAELPSGEVIEAKDVLDRHGIRFLAGGKFLGEAGFVPRVTGVRVRERVRGLAPETFNQEIAFLTMYRKGREQGMDDAEAARYALLRGNIYSQFLGLRTDQPRAIYRQATTGLQAPVKSAIFQFRRFQVKNLEVGLDLLRNRNLSGATMWLGSQILIGGLKGLTNPFVALAGGAYVSLQVYEAIKKEYGETLANVVAYGLPGLLGMDMSYSTQLFDVPYGSTIQEAVGNLALGPAGSTVVSGITAALGKQAEKGVVEEPLERFFRAIRQRAPGLRWIESLEQIWSGKYEFRDPQGRLKFKGDLQDVLLNMGGFRTLTQADQDLILSAFLELRQRRDRALDRAAQPFAGARAERRTPSPDEWKRGREAIAEWNGLYPEVPVTMGEVQRRAKGRMEALTEERLKRTIERGPKALRRAFQGRQRELTKEAVGEPVLEEAIR